MFLWRYDGEYKKMGSSDQWGDERDKAERVVEPAWWEEGLFGCHRTPVMDNRTTFSVGQQLNTSVN